MDRGPRKGSTPSHCNNPLSLGFSVSQETQALRVISIHRPFLGSIRLYWLVSVSCQTDSETATFSFWFSSGFIFKIPFPCQLLNLSGVWRFEEKIVTDQRLWFHTKELLSWEGTLKENYFNSSPGYINPGMCAFFPPYFFNANFHKWSYRKYLILIYTQIK